MNKQLLNRLDIHALRHLLAQHMRKCICAIEIGSTYGDLKEIRKEVKDIDEILEKKEIEFKKNA